MANSRADTLFVTILLVFVLYPTLRASIDGIIVGKKHVNATCDDAAVVQLPVWNFVFAGAGFLMVIGVMIGVVMMQLKHHNAFSAIIAPLYMYQTFTIAWSIVGAVSLFRDSATCEALVPELYGVTLTALVVQWVGLAFSFFVGKREDMYKG